ncbi:MAG: ImmA/IrrE family metallo-endopeptidase [Propionivibrio sp.]|uniref:ImmA/IrrE family metallo-endopeptidase n=1 Tax=Propionivibrio sp. TaxID=2212460 RepID=UPI0025E0D794|nr:ImmA/IrrE family metallo-endopeptidase [Propionivibrio sp.]MBL0208780.1 ImmA/IrrE family metallo-endopeptidase [Propionivibrio sp.]
MANRTTDRKPLSKAEALLWEYGIDRPEQIDLEAIAADLGAIVRYAPLEGSEARIVGNGDRAIITVASGGRPRQRFSVAHEIGHWVERHGRGGFLCGKEDIAPQNDQTKSVEALANAFASQLVLPSYLFDPIIAGQPVTLDIADKIGKQFQASLTATAIKMVRSAAKPALVVCHSREKREWFVRGPGVPEEYWPVMELDYETDAFELLYSSDAKGKTAVRQAPGARWLSGKGAYARNVRAQSVKVADGMVISIVVLEP